MSKDSEHSPGHPMREVTRVAGGHGGDAVVAWCPVCGAVAVDLEVDGRRVPGGVTPLQFPAITLDAMLRRDRRELDEA